MWLDCIFAPKESSSQLLYYNILLRTMDVKIIYFAIVWANDHVVVSSPNHVSIKFIATINSVWSAVVENLVDRNICQKQINILAWLA